MPVADGYNFSFVRTTPEGGDPSASSSEIRSECLELCRQRYVTGASRQVTRDGLPRSVPWDLVETTWRRLSTGPDIVCSTDGTFTTACQMPSQKLKMLMDSLQASGRLQSVAWPRPSGLGVDGVRLWKSNVVSVSLAPCSVLDGLPMHSMYRFSLSAVQRSQESVAALHYLMQSCGLSEDAVRLNGTVLPGFPGFTVRVFVCGDHMAQYKLCGANGPGSEHDGMQACPYCAAWPRLTSDLAYVPDAVLDAARPNALVAIPPLQCPPDVMHGAVNVLHNSLLPVLRDSLLGAGWSDTAYCSYVSSILHIADHADLLQYPKVDTIGRSIDSTLAFFRSRKWLDVLTVLQANVSADVVRGFRGAFGAMTTMLDIAYDPMPPAADRVRFAEAAATQRQAMQQLGCRCTPWVHVWLGHLRHFLDHWRTLYPFIGHGVESRHRLLKREISRSTCGQWKGTQVGFAHCLRRDNVWWSLLREVSDPNRRQGSVNRRRAALFQQFRDEAAVE